MSSFKDLVVKIPLPSSVRDSLLRRFTPVLLRYASGKITWPRSWYQPAPADPETVAQAVNVTAYVMTPGQFTPGGQATALVRKTIATGLISEVFLGPDTVTVEYIITHLPKGTLVFIAVEVVNKALFHGPGDTTGFEAVGDRSLVLNDQLPYRTGIDFKGISFNLH